MRARRVFSRNHVLPWIGKKEEKEDIIIEVPSSKSHHAFPEQSRAEGKYGKSKALAEKNEE